MTLPESVSTEIVEIAAATAFANRPEDVPKGWPKVWDELPPFLQHDFREHLLMMLTPAFPVIERYGDKGWENAAVLRARVEMVIAEWVHRESLMSPALLAADLQRVLDEPIET